MVGVERENRDALVTLGIQRERLDIRCRCRVNVR